MQAQTLGRSTLVASRLSYGCMRFRGDDPEYSFQCVRAACEAGYTLFDHADIYGGGYCETLFGKALRRIPGLREHILIATKCGIRFPGDPSPDSPHRYDFSSEHIIASCEGSLKRLGVETIDLYQLHRPDYLCNPQEIAEAFAQLKDQGKVREFGVSNFRPTLVMALQKACPMPLIVNQVEIHLGRLDCFDDGTLDQCLAESVTPLAWSPLGGGFLGEGGRIESNHPRAEGINTLLRILDETADSHGVSRTVIALAWLLKHPSRIIPIVGSANPDHIRDAAKADTVDLSREEWYRILTSARMKPLP